MSTGDRAAGIIIGLLLGVAIVLIFVFVFSEDTVDAPSIGGDSPPAECPSENR